MRRVDQIVATFGLLVSTISLGGCGDSCPAGRTKVGRDCIREDVADLSACVTRSTGGEVTSDRGITLDNEAAALGAQVKSKDEFADKLKEIFNRPDADATRRIIEICREQVNKKSEDHLQRNVGYAVGAGGLASTAVGSIFLGLAMSKNSDSRATCNGNVCGDPGYGLRQDARADGNLATGFYILGGAAIAIAGLLILTDTSQSPTTQGASPAAPRFRLTAQRGGVEATW